MRLCTARLAGRQLSAGRADLLGGQALPLVARACAPLPIRGWGQEDATRTVRDQEPGFRRCDRRQGPRLARIGPAVRLAGFAGSAAAVLRLAQRPAWLWRLEV